MNAAPDDDQDERGLTPEDAARASLYALLSRVFRAGPDRALLRMLAGASDVVEGDSDLARTWHQFCTAAAAADAHAETLEFDTVFVGVGKAPVSTYLSHYVTAGRKDLLLADLRGELAELGLMRLRSSVEPEDNLASVLEAMRHLVIAGSDESALRRQREFSSHYLLPAYGGFVAAAEAVTLSTYHHAAVQLLAAFLEVERAQLSMD